VDLKKKHFQIVKTNNNQLINDLTVPQCWLIHKMDLLIPQSNKYNLNESIIARKPLRIPQKLLIHAFIRQKQKIKNKDNKQL
jgi:hypothetical protein